MRRFAFLAVLLLLSASLIDAQDVTPVPTLDPSRYSAMHQVVTSGGFPQLGFPSAPVSVVIYGAFDDPASGVFWRDVFPSLLPRITTGEVRITYVPLTGRGTIPTGRGAARAALCAAEQNAFWSYHDMLFTWQLEFTNDAFAGSRLIDGATNSPINRGTWDECMLSDRPDRVLNEAEVIASESEIPVVTPFVTINDAPTFPDAASLESGIQFEIARNMATFESVVSATDEVETTPDPESTEPVVVTLEPLLGESTTPPLIIGLPPGWVYGYDTLLLNDYDAIRNMPIAVYTGPVTGGQGTIILLWAFPNLIPSTGTDGVTEPNLWADGLRLLRLAILEQDCNIGTDLRREYSVGGLTAVGTQFAAVDCPELPDTRGWFAGLQQFNLNFVFYAYAEPISAMDGNATTELQSILDSIQFVLPPSATPAAP